MGRDRNSRVFRNVAGHLLRSSLDDEAAEAPQVDVLVRGQRVLDAFHERFHDLLHLRFFDTGAF